MLQLTCNETGQAYSALQNRILLIGGARFCQCTLPEGQRVETALVRYPEGWVIHELQGSSVTRNGIAIQGRSYVADGDVITCGNCSLRVSHSVAAGPPSEPSSPRPCQLKITAAGGLAEEYEISTDTLVGTYMLCDIRLPDNHSFKAKHCLIASSQNNWYVVDLTGSGGLHNSQRWQNVIRVVHNDSAQIGELKLSFQLHPDSCREIPQTTQESSETGQIQNLDTDVESERLMAAATPTTPRPRTDSDPVAKTAQEVFNNVRARHLVTMQPGNDFARLLKRTAIIPKQAEAERSFMSGYKESALQMLGKLLADDPWNRQLLITFARMCDAIGMHHLCLSILNVLQRMNRDDTDVLKSIARVALCLAEEEPRYYSLSIQYWKQVRARLPAESTAIESIIRDISARQAIRRNRLLNQVGPDATQA